MPMKPAIDNDNLRRRLEVRRLKRRRLEVEGLMKLSRDGKDGFISVMHVLRGLNSNGLLVIRAPRYAIWECMLP